MRRYPAAPVAVVLVHFSVAASAFFLGRVPAAVTFYLGLFGSSEELGSAFLHLLYPAPWLLSTFHLPGPLMFSPVLLWACVAASSVFYGLLAAAGLSAIRYLRRPRSVAAKFGGGKPGQMTRFHT